MKTSVRQNSVNALFKAGGFMPLIMLEVKNLTISFCHRRSSSFRGKLQEKKAVAVNRVSFSMEAGEILGIVGESGSGKSTVALALAGLLKREALIEEGAIDLGIDDLDLLSLNEKQRKAYRGNYVGMVFQEPMSALNPTMKIGKQVEEALVLHTSLSKHERKEEVLKALRDVELGQPEKIYHQYPHELSGGMRQRVLIAAAMICHPLLLIADEPTTALDVDTQKEILKLLKKMNQRYGMGILFISHDLHVINEICDRVLVMKDGHIVERGNVREVLTSPAHPYTQMLIDAVPKHTERQVTYQTIGGDQDGDIASK